MERRDSDRPVPPPHRFLAPEGSRALGASRSSTDIIAAQRAEHGIPVAPA